MLNFEQACRRIRKHNISIIFVETSNPKGKSWRWYAGENGVLVGYKAGAFVNVTPFGGNKEDSIVCEGTTIEEAVEKYCEARRLS